MPVGVNGLAAGIFGGPQQKKPREILAVAFDGAAQYVGPVDLRRDRGSDRTGVFKPLVYNHFDAARSVIKRSLFNLRVPGKKIQALIQGHRMRKYAFYL